MNIDDCYQLGYIVKVHGTKGGVVIFLDTDEPYSYYQMESVFVLTNEGLIPFFIEGFEQTNQDNKLITYFEDIETIEAAQKLKGAKLFLPLDDLEKLDENQFYYHEVKNFEIIDTQLGKIGNVKTIYEMPTQDMLAFDYNDHEIMIPLKEPIYAGINKDKKQIQVNLPEGYLEVFTSDPNKRDDDEV